MSSFSFKYYVIPPSIIPEPAVLTLMPLIAKHNESLGVNNQHLFIFSNTRRRNNKERELINICLGFNKETTGIVKHLIITAKERAKTLKIDSNQDKVPTTV